MKRLGIMAGVAAIALGSVAFAGGMLEKADANKDGKITQQEMQSSRDARFAALDLNKDGFIDASEAQKGAKDHDGKGRHGKHHRMGMGGPEMGMRGDENKDGQITRTEFMAQAGERFDRMDFNKDGVLSKTDREAHKAACESGKVLCGPLAMLDTNKDARISKAEFMAAPNRFERMDANKDGVIDKSEIDSAKAKWKDHRGKGPDGGPDGGPGAPANP